MTCRRGSARRAAWAATWTLLAAAAAAPAAAQPADDVAQAAVRRCARLEAAARTPCYEAVLLPIAEKDVAAALATLEAIAARDQDVRRNGHLYVHGIGIAGYDAARDPADSFTECTELFHAGCYHGVIQAYFSATDAVDSAAVNGLCTRVRQRKPDQWIYFQCVHGLGHGLTIHASHDLVDGLEGCDLLVTAWERESCYGGAFMENVGNATHPHHNSQTAALPSAGHGDHGTHAAAEPFKAIDPADPHYPCTIVGTRYLAACYGMQTTVILHLNGYDFAAAARTCDGAPASVRAVCHQSLGRDASGFAEQDHRRTIDFCLQDRSPDAVWCYVGAVKAITDWSGKPDEGLGFCAAVADGPARVRCVEAVGEQIAVMVGTAEARREACGRARAGYVDVCLYGARLTADKPALLRALETGGI